MRRYLILAVLFCLTLPFDLSMTGCYRNPAANFCENLGYGAKNDAIASITLLPNTTGLSIPFGETGNTQTPQAKSCTNSTVSVGAYNWGTTDMNIADVNPTTGQLCAGNWNRTSNGGVAAYTTCLPTNKQGIAYITASAGNVTSNTVAVYVHPQIASVSLSTTRCIYGSASNPSLCPSTLPSYCGAAVNSNQCLSQGCSAVLDVTATPVGSSAPFCGPNSSTVPECSTILGTLSYSPVVGTVATINNYTSLATANLPGATEITTTTNSGNTSGGTTTSSAGYFYTCTPQSVSLTANGSQSIAVTPNNPQAITAAVTDVNGNPITGLALTYASTEAQNIPVAATGSITSVYPGTASVVALCQPPGCNPAPISKIGVNGAGTPIVSNPLQVTSSGTSSTILYMASPKSQFFSAIDFTVGEVTSPVKLPYAPNSMVLSQTGTSLYFGSWHELISVSTSNNTVSKEDPSAPGVVLAASPDGSTLLINDQNLGKFYLYGTASSGGITSTFAGWGQHAQFSSDSETVYIVGNNAAGTPTLFVHNVFTGWSTVALTGGVGSDTNLAAATPITAACQAFLSGQNLPSKETGTYNTTTGVIDANLIYNRFCAPDLSVAVPATGPYISGAPASASYGFCPNAAASPVTYYPLAGTLPETTDRLVATINSEHVIGASVSSTLAGGPQLTDSAVTPFTGGCPLTPGTSGGTAAALSNGFTLTNPGNTPHSLAGYGIANIDQIVADPDSSLAVVTYTSTATMTPAGGAKLPVYKIPAASSTSGTVTGVTLSGSAIAPIAGIFSPDTKTFFAATTGDNLVHLISTASLTETGTITPGLPEDACVAANALPSCAIQDGNITPVQFLAVKPRSQP